MVEEPWGDKWRMKMKERIPIKSIKICFDEALIVVDTMSDDGKGNIELPSRDFLVDALKGRLRKSDMEVYSFGRDNHGWLVSVDKLNKALGIKSVERRNIAAEVIKEAEPDNVSTPSDKIYRPRTLGVVQAPEPLL